MSVLDRVSPKVSLPAALLAVGGAVVVVAGVLIGDGQLIAIGVSLLSASGLTAGVGYRVKDPARPVRRTVSRRDRGVIRRSRARRRRSR